MINTRHANYRMTTTKSTTAWTATVAVILTKARADARILRLRHGVRDNSQDVRTGGKQSPNKHWLGWILSASLSFSSLSKPRCTYADGQDSLLNQTIVK